MYSVREFAQATFKLLDLDWEQYVKYDARYERPAEVDLLLGDPSKAKKVLGWEPKINFEDLVHEMVASDYRLAEEELAVKNAREKSTPPPFLSKNA